MAEPEDTVRLLIADTMAPPDQLLDDTQITAFLALEGGSIKRAAAQALDTIASSEVLVSKKIRSQDLATDGPAVADALRKHAAALRQQAKDDDDLVNDVTYFDVVEFVGDWCSPEVAEWQML